MAALLLVDGDHNFGRALEIALRLEGVDVAVAQDGVEAARLLSQRHFDLIAVDALLPEADALISAARQGRQGRTLATGTHRELLDRAARRHGVPTLEKPFGAEALLHAL